MSRALFFDDDDAGDYDDGDDDDDGDDNDGGDNDDGDDDDGDDGGLSTRLSCGGHDRMCARESLTCRRPLPRTSSRIENGWNQWWQLSHLLQRSILLYAHYTDWIADVSAMNSVALLIFQ